MYFHFICWIPKLGLIDDNVFIEPPSEWIRHAKQCNKLNSDEQIHQIWDLRSISIKYRKQYENKGSYIDQLSTFMPIFTHVSL